MRFPPVAETIAREPTGVVAEAQIQVAQIAFDVVKAVRINHAKGGAGKIVIPGFLGFLRVQAAFPEEKPQKFLVFDVHAHDRIVGPHECFAILGDDLKLLITIGMLPHGERFADLASPQVMALQQLGDDGDTDEKATPRQFFSDLGSGKVRPYNAVLIRVACGTRIDDFEKSLVDFRTTSQRALSATPFFRAA